MPWAEKILDSRPLHAKKSFYAIIIDFPVSLLQNLKSCMNFFSLFELIIFFLWISHENKQLNNEENANNIEFAKNVYALSRVQFLGATSPLYISKGALIDLTTTRLGRMGFRGTVSPFYIDFRLI